MNVTGTNTSYVQKALGVVNATGAVLSKASDVALTGAGYVAKSVLPERIVFAGLVLKEAVSTNSWVATGNALCYAGLTVADTLFSSSSPSSTADLMLPGEFSYGDGYLPSAINHSSKEMCMADEASLVPVPLHSPTPISVLDDGYCSASGVASAAVLTAGVAVGTYGMFKLAKGIYGLCSRPKPPLTKAEHTAKALSAVGIGTFEPREPISVFEYKHTNLGLVRKWLEPDFIEGAKGSHLRDDGSVFPVIRGVVKLGKKVDDAIEQFEPNVGIQLKGLDGHHFSAPKLENAFNKALKEQGGKALVLAEAEGKGTLFLKLKSEINEELIIAIKALVSRINNEETGEPLSITHYYEYKPK